MSCKYSHADQSYNNLEFLVAAILIYLMEAIAKSGEYTNLHANIHMHNTVIEIFSF